MAELKLSGLDDLMLDMKALAEIPDEVQSNMLNAMADVVVSAQKAKGQALGVNRTGLTLDSIKKTKVKKLKSGMSITVEPSGTRKRGKKSVRNAEIAFVNEYGKKNQAPRPFINLANEESADEQTNAALKVYDDWLKSKNL